MHPHNHEPASLRLRSRMQIIAQAFATPRAANVVFAIALAVGFITLLAVNSRSWFVGDEFVLFFVRREALAQGHFGEWLLSPHNEHIMVIPILVFWPIFKLFGLHSYVPYLVPVFAAHIGVLILARALMIRAGIHIWLATGLAISLIFFGGGDENLTWAFQFGFVGALCFALLAFVLIDHDGKVGPRDVAGAACAIAAVLCTNVAIPFIMMLTAYLLIRRRWMAAAVIAVPPAIVWAAWFVTYGRNAANLHPASINQLLEIPQFIWIGIVSAYEGVVQLPGIGAVLALVVVGVAFASRPLTRQLAIVTATLIGILVFYAVISYGRVSFGVEQAAATRYGYLAGILALIGIGFALQRINFGLARTILALSLLIGWMAVANSARYAHEVGAAIRVREQLRDELIAVATLPNIDAVPADTLPEPVLAPNVYLSGLLDLARSGELPSTANVPPTARLNAALYTLLRVDRTPVPPTPPNAQVHAEPAWLPLQVNAGCASTSSAIVLTGTGTITVTSSRSGPMQARFLETDSRTESDAREIPVDADQPVGITSRFPDTDLRLTPPAGSVLRVCGLR